MDERGFLVPRSPGVQLRADLLGDLASVLGVPSLEQVVAGLEQVMHIGGGVLRPHPDPPLPVPGRPDGQLSREASSLNMPPLPGLRHPALRRNKP